MKLKDAAIAAVLAVAAIYAFAVGAQAQDSRASVWPTGAWEVSTPEEQGMDSRAVARFIDEGGTYKQDSSPPVAPRQHLLAAHEFGRGFKANRRRAILTCAAARYEPSNT